MIMLTFLKLVQGLNYLIAVKRTGMGAMGHTYGGHYYDSTLST